MEKINCLFYFVTEIIMVISFILCYKEISDCQFKKTTFNIFIILVASVILILNNLYNFAGLKIACSAITLGIVAYLSFGDKVKNIVTNIIMYIFVGMIVEIFFSIIFIKLIKNITTLNSSVILKCSISIFYSIVTVLIFKIKFVKNNINKLKKLLCNKILNFYFLSIIIAFILIVSLYYLGTEYKSSLFIIYEAICTICIIIGVRTIINDKHNNMILSDKNKELIDSYKAYSNTIEEYREFKHNLKNDLYYLKTNLGTNDQEKVNNLISKYNTNIDWINKINDIPQGLQGIILLKINEAKQQKINIFVNTTEEIFVDNKEVLDFSNILGILIDNAIDATKNAKAKSITINISKIKKDLKIEIINKFTNIIDLKKIGEKNYSTKQYKSGIGLNYISKLAKPNISVNFKIMNDIFITDILYKKNSK